MYVKKTEYRQGREEREERENKKKQKGCFNKEVIVFDRHKQLKKQG